MVPFKKSLHDYFSTTRPVDSHCFRFSANTMRGLLAVSGFEIVHVNRYMDTDYLVMIGRKTDKSAEIPWEKDDWRQVVDFFDRWDKETRDHFREA